MNIVLKPYPGESQASFLRRFSGKVRQEGLLEEVREKMTYKKQAEIKKEERLKRRNKINEYKRKLVKD